MKTIKLIYTVIIASIICFFNCSKDDDSGSNVDSENIIGSWRLIKEVDVFEGETDTYTVPVGCNEIILIFTDTTIQSVEDYDCDGVTNDTTSSAYSINGNTITANGESALIQELSQDQLIIRESISNSEYTDMYFNKL